jgi:MFS family permease
MNPSRSLVPALSLTLLLSWGSLYYAFAMLMHPMQRELNWSATSMMGGYSLALLVWGLSTYPVGRLIDRYGGRLAMTLGSCLCGVLFFVLSHTKALWAFYLVWAGLGAGMALTLYEPAFAVLVEAWPRNYRHHMGVLTLAGGLASTVFWPLTHVLVAALGWRDTVLVYALIQLFICAPLHWFVIPTLQRCSTSVSNERTLSSATAPFSSRTTMRSSAFYLLAVSFAAFGFVTAAIATHVVPIVESRGVTTAAALAIAALIGPMQVAGRSTDLMLAGRLSPLATGAVTVALIPIAVLTLWAASSAFVLLYAFAALYGVGLGLLTIVRATSPVEIFGVGSYATVSGALSGPSVLARAAGPLAGTFLIAMHHSYDTVLLVLLACALGGAAAYMFAIRKEPS